MHTGCNHNRCTDYESFAKRNISHQFKSLINSLTIGYLPIFSPMVALGFMGGGQNFCLGERPPDPPLIAALGGFNPHPGHVVMIFG